MKRWFAGSLLVVLAGVILAGMLLVGVFNGNRDPIAVLEEFGALNEKFGTHTIERNETGEVCKRRSKSAPGGGPKVRHPGSGISRLSAGVKSLLQSVV